MFEMTHDFEYMWLKLFTNRIHNAAYILAETQQQKQKADGADTLTIIIRVLQCSYTTTQQFSLGSGKDANT